VKLPRALGDLPQPLYFFDGHCVLCSGFVAFCLARDPAGRLKFASAQSALGQRVLTELGLPDDTFDRTILLLDGEDVHTRSAAALRALRYLRGPVRWLRPLLLIPTWLRSALRPGRAQPLSLVRPPAGVFRPRRRNARPLHRSVSQPR
jgi:predicted DCC family thiol-disulfide oxidoreductase YuxK